MKEVLFKVLVIAMMLGLMGFGIFYIIKNEESGYPRYEIRQDHEFYRTDVYSLDSIGCLHFIEFRERLFNDPKKRPITICGGKYSITDRNQVK